MEDKIYTTFNISKIIKVSLPTVTNWINDKKLKAFITPGGHRRVKSSELLIFLKQYNLPIPPELESFDKIKILIIDDDQELLNVIVKALKNKSDKYETLTATDGFDAGRALTQFNPDLVVLDIMLPGIDGFKICGLHSAAPARSETGRSGLVSLGPVSRLARSETGQRAASADLQIFGNLRLPFPTTTAFRSRWRGARACPLRKTGGSAAAGTRCRSAA